jgi:molybdopterin synthase sulfur carrier subunit
MARVVLTPHLRRFFSRLEEIHIVAGTVADLVAALDGQHPGLAAYIVDERGALRRHVNIFIGEEPVRDRERLGDPLGPDDTVYILQALSGG